MTARNAFGQQLLDEVLLFLKEDGDQDAAFVPSMCKFSAGEDMDSHVYLAP